MGKTASNNSFARKANEKYFTIDPRAVTNLLQLIPPGSTFAEPCAGAGHLIDHLKRGGLRCAWASDIEPERGDIHSADILGITDLPECDYIITNPPWDPSRKQFWQIVEHCMKLRPTWVLHSHSTLSAARAAPRLRHAIKTVPTARLIWQPGTTQTSSQPTCWTLFDIHYDGALIYLPFPESEAS